MRQAAIAYLHFSRLSSPPAFSSRPRPRSHRPHGSHSRTSTSRNAGDRRRNRHDGARAARQHGAQRRCHLARRGRAAADRECQRHPAAAVERRSAGARAVRRAGGFQHPRRRIRSGAGDGGRRASQRRAVRAITTRTFPCRSKRSSAIEVLRGAGSSLHGADAFGGTINIITKRAAPRASFDLAGGSLDLFEAAAGAGLQQRLGDRGAAITHALHGSFTRSSGFMTARDHRVGTVQYQASAGSRGSLLLAHTDKEFGANGFYGPAPSREWTRQSLARYEQRLVHADRWQGAFHRRVSRARRSFHLQREQSVALREPSSHQRRQRTGEAALHGRARHADQHGRRRRRRLDPLEQSRRSRLRARRHLHRDAAADRQSRPAASRPALRYLQPLRLGLESVARRQRVGLAARQVPRVRRSCLPRADVHGAVLPGPEPSGER